MTEKETIIDIKLNHAIFELVDEFSCCISLSLQTKKFTQLQKRWSERNSVGENLPLAEKEYLVVDGLDLIVHPLQLDLHRLVTGKVKGILINHS